MRSRVIGTVGQQSSAVNEALLSVGEAAEQLRVSKSWLYQNRDIPSVKLGRNRRWRQSDLKAYVEAHVSHLIGGVAL